MYPAMFIVSWCNAYHSVPSRTTRYPCSARLAAKSDSARCISCWSLCMGAIGPDSAVLTVRQDHPPEIGGNGPVNPDDQITTRSMRSSPYVGGSFACDNTAPVA